VGAEGVGVGEGEAEGEAGDVFCGAELGAEARKCHGCV